MSKKIAIFPGSFDPITVGHEAIIKRGIHLFDEIVVAVGSNTTKNYMYPLSVRTKWIEDIFYDQEQVNVKSYEGLTVNFCESIGAQFILRGLRTSADFEFERQIGQMNEALNKKIQTVFLLANQQHSAISSTIVREIIKSGGDASQFVPKQVNLNEGNN
ncbi:MAG: pantetheine-phosphate adenylyltransferase [Bacteroidetes bacterium]|nr:pantetheine-phosphate adenylyltransferase [Bacteroidota bacterium]